MKLVSL